MDQLELRAVPATIAWDGGSTGMGTNWLDPVNWVGDVLPGANDAAVIETAANGHAAAVILSGTASVQSVSVTAGATLTVAGMSSGSAGQLTCDGGDLSNNGLLQLGHEGWSGDARLIVPGFTLNNSATGVIDIVAGAGGSRTINGGVPPLGFPSGTHLVNQGTVSISAGTSFVGYFENSGTISVESGGGFGVTTLYGASVNSGTMSASGGGISLLRFDPSIGMSSFTNSGTISVSSGQSFLITSPLTNYIISTHTLTGGVYNIAGTFSFQTPVFFPYTPVWIQTLNADVTLAAAGVSIRDARTGANSFLPVTTVTATSHLTLMNGATASFSCVNHGVLTIGVGSSASSVLNAGLLAGSGVISALQNSGANDTQGNPFEGTVLPDGKLTVIGDFFGTPLHSTRAAHL